MFSGESWHLQWFDDIRAGAIVAEVVLVPLDVAGVTWVLRPQVELSTGQELLSVLVCSQGGLQLQHAVNHLYQINAWCFLYVYSLPTLLLSLLLW